MSRRLPIGVATICSPGARGLSGSLSGGLPPPCRPVAWERSFISHPSARSLAPMRLSFLALATVAFLLGACTEAPQTTTPPPPPKPTGPQPGSPTTASGKARIALLLPLSGGSAPIGQAMQQAAEMALFDTGAKELALAAYDSGETGDQAVEAYKKAQTDGAALILGPLFGGSVTAL